MRGRSQSYYIFENSQSLTERVDAEKKKEASQARLPLARALVGAAGQRGPAAVAGAAGGPARAQLAGLL